MKNKQSQRQWLIGLQTGGLMEDPVIRYENLEVIGSDHSLGAVAIYNKKYNCNYFYGVCLAEVVDGKVDVEYLIHKNLILE